MADVIEINKTIIDSCIALRKGQAIKLPDAIIAATALSLGYTLITNNESLNTAGLSRGGLNKQV